MKYVPKMLAIMFLFPQFFVCEKAPTSPERELDGILIDKQLVSSWFGKSITELENYLSNNEEAWGIARSFYPMDDSGHNIRLSRSELYSLFAEGEIGGGPYKNSDEIRKASANIDVNGTLLYPIQLSRDARILDQYLISKVYSVSITNPDESPNQKIWIGVRIVQ